ncbi:MAG TPA: hypothetical protein VK997_09110, partial [Deferrisomatales bacterium]|nr:hypothetical protein [Deferrisomatales bacterium]
MGDAGGMAMTTRGEDTRAGDGVANRRGGVWRGGRRLLAGLAVALLAVTLLGGTGGAADTPSGPAGASPAATSPQEPALELAALVPRVTQVAERFARLQAMREELRTPPVDAAEVEKKAERAAELEQSLEHILRSRTAGHDQFSDLRAAVRAEEDVLSRESGQLTAALQRLDTLRVEWLEEAQYWQRAGEVVTRREGYEGVRESVASAARKSEQALALLAGSSAPTVEVQKQIGDLRGRLQEVATAIDGSLRTLREDIYRPTGFPLTSPRFFEQFQPSLLDDLRGNLGRVSWPAGRFFASYGWVILLQVVVAAGVARAIHRRRAALVASPRWGFLASHALAAGVFVGFSLLTPLYGSVLPPVWRLLMWLLTVVGVARLVSSRVHTDWQRRLLYLLATLFLLTQALRLVGVPLPIFR